MDIYYLGLDLDVIKELKPIFNYCKENNIKYDYEYNIFNIMLHIYTLDTYIYDQVKQITNLTYEEINLNLKVGSVEAWMTTYENDKMIETRI